MRLHVPTALRWSDLDAYGHVNNASMLRLLEEARIQAFWVADHSSGPVSGTTAVLDGRPGSDTITLISRLEIEYIAQIPYHRQPLDVQLWIGEMSGARLEVCYEVRSPQSEAPAQTLYARAATSVVLVDGTNGRPRRIGEHELAAWKPYLDDPIVFRKRG